MHIERVIEYLKKLGLCIIVEGNIDDLLGANINRGSYVSIKLT